jgi:hypothetical protein
VRHQAVLEDVSALAGHGSSRDSGAFPGPANREDRPQCPEWQPGGNRAATTRTQQARASMIRAVSVTSGRRKRLGGRVEKDGRPSILVRGLDPTTVPGRFRRSLSARRGYSPCARRASYPSGGGAGSAGGRSPTAHD